MLKRTVRHAAVAVGLFAIVGITASTAAGFAGVHHGQAQGVERDAMPTPAGDLGEVIIHAPGELGEIVVHAPHDLADVRVSVRRSDSDRYLAQVVVSAPRSGAFDPDQLVAAR